MSSEQDEIMSEAEPLKAPTGEGAASNTVVMASEPAPENQIDTNGLMDATETTDTEALAHKSKVASLRAAFEQGGRPTEGMKRQFSSASGQGHDDEIARLREDLEKERDLRLAYEEKVTALEEEIEELDAQVERRDATWAGEYERRSQEERHEAEKRLIAMAKEARNQRQEAINLQKQLSELKRSVSTSTRTTARVSDTTLQQEVEVLRHECQNWVVQNFRRIKIEGSGGDRCSRLEKMVVGQQLERLQNLYRDFDPVAKLPVIQATLAIYLMEIFDDPYLFGLDSQVGWVQRPRQASEALSSVLQPAIFNRWRAITFDGLRQIEQVKEQAERATCAIAEAISNTLRAVTDVDESEARLISLKVIIRRAVDLAHLIRAQPAQYTFGLPSPGDDFDATSMDDIAEDNEADGEGTIRCATFPTIVKNGDEEGDHSELENIVIKARVLRNSNEP